jgi:hypothetical protein
VTFRHFARLAFCATIRPQRGFALLLRPLHAQLAHSSAMNFSDEPVAAEFPTIGDQLQGVNDDDTTTD